MCVCVGKLDIISGGCVNDTIPSGQRISFPVDMWTMDIIHSGYRDDGHHRLWLWEDRYLFGILLVMDFIKTESNFKFK